MKKTYGPYTVSLSNLTKPLIGSITKGDIIAYYEMIADTMLPYTKNHPLMMHRFPEGITGESFYQKDASNYFPDWIKKVHIKKKGGYYDAVIAQNTATLVYLANQACITPHLWLSQYDELNKPDKIIFDLDPSIKDFSMIQDTALAIKELLDTLGLTSFVMTSGSRGLHVYIPLRRTADFKQTKAFATACAKVIIDKHPTMTTLEIRKDKRGKKVFIDTLRNEHGATSVAPYAIRAKPHAPVATPIYWSAVGSAELNPQLYTINNIADHLAQGDPWKDYTARQTLTEAIKLLRNILPV